MLSSTFQVNMEDFKIFHQVVVEGSFLRASQKLHTNQPKITRSVARLERNFGTLLLHRDMRNVCLTRTGEIVFKMATQMLGCFYQGHMEAEQEQKEMAGPIIISVSTGFGHAWLMPILKPFLDEYPKIDIIFRDEDDDYANLMLGDADIAIISEEPDPRESLECHLLCEYPLLTYASETYLARHGIPSSVKDLDYHKIIGWEENFPGSKDYFLRANFLLYAGRSHNNPRKAVMYVNSDTSVMSAALQDFGLAFIPQNFAKKHSELKYVPLEEDGTPLISCFNKKYILHHKAAYLSKRHKHVIELIRAKTQEDSLLKKISEE